MFRRGIAGMITALIPASLAAQGVEISASAEAATEEAKPTVEIAAEAENVDDATAGESSTVSEVPKIPESFDGKLDYGHSLYLKGDFAGALNLYNMAKQAKSNDPLVLYFIACAEAKLNRLDEALSALAAMKTLSGEKLPSLTAKALFLTAIIEEMRLDDDRAMAAWEEYKTYMQGHSKLPAFIGSADARIQAIQKKRALYEQYEIVRQRITASN